ncbi:Signal transduction histidine kinase [Filimonas lacunae]|uniref:histidine kinase n=1 Tax=Filimonas lacunae TaxID=477680 RepID=A0A173MQE4_9BACT|nr:two-component regulator propeller domain-containing protein [Filimonas lacunae]BAV09558.1 two-component hybrid sensor and regulator [Filimonas lacunae]SIS75187.1 Signal transduction histidine kinase [Filimonas lacunae]
MCHILKAILFGVLCVTVPFYIWAQPGKYRFTRVNTKQGLSHNQVNCITKDENGFIWIGTMSGLNRYDGYGCKVYKQGNSDSNNLRDNYITAMYSAPDGMLWINTPAGVTLYNSRLDKFDNNYLGRLRLWRMPPGNVTSIQKDKQGHFWFLIDGKLCVYQPAAPAGASPYFIQPATVPIMAFTFDNNSHVWIVYKNGIAEQRDVVSGKLLFATAVLQKQTIGDLQNCQVYADAHNGLWIAGATNTGGAYYINAADSNSGCRHYIIPHIIKGITEEAGGLIWIGTDHGGVYIVNKETGTIQDLLNDAEDDKTISQNSITALYKDEQGVIWLGTYKQGLCFYNENVLSFLVNKHKPGDASSLPYDDVNRFVEDNKGNVWIGTNGGGLIYYNTQQKKFTQYLHNPDDANSLCNNVIVSLCLDKQGLLWIGTFYGGLDCFNGKRFMHYRHTATDSNSIADDNIWELLEDSKGRLWVGTLKAGVDRFDREKNIFYHYPGGASKSVGSTYISAIIEDNHQQLWFGTDVGLDKYNPATNNFTHYKHLPNNFIISLLQDSRGLLWAGTRNGLCLLDGNTGKLLTTLTITDGLPDNAILNILEDAQHTLWISTPLGIGNITVEPGGAKGWAFRFKNYNELNNLQERAFNENAALKLKNGLLLFGGANGFNSIDPLHTVIPATAHRLLLTDFQVSNKSISAGEIVNGRPLLTKSIYKTDTLWLKYKENDFSIEFAEMGFAQSGKDEYAYRLDGFNKEWLLTSGLHRRATYTNLDPGTYVFHVKAADGNGGWNTQQASLVIIISPPFWKTPFAFLLYMIVIAGALAIARKITVDRTRMRFAIEQQQKEADRMHALDMMKIRFFTNVSHEFRTPLSLILSPLDKIGAGLEEDKRKQLQLVKRNARRLLNLVNQLLDFRKLEMQEFKFVPVRGDIIAFIKETVLSFSDIAEKKDIRFAFHTGIQVFETFFDKDKLEKILFNLLSNAFKFTPQQGTVEVIVSWAVGLPASAMQQLEIQVKDSGIGIAPENQEQVFERFFQSDMPEAVINQGSGIGLAITKEFVKLHGGEITLTSELNKGSLFSVLLPLQPAGIMLAEGDAVMEDIAIHQWQEEEAVDVAVLEPEPTKRRKETILLVEDNEDFRFYLKENLRHWFVILEAANGREGWKQAQTRQPDLVVTDVMMPVMNGLELARKIHNDPRTSHIPVILLTARSEEEQELEGFDTGASDYITKPFNFEILLARLRNLLMHRQMVRKSFEKKLEINPAEIAVTPLDEKFMQQALDVVEKNIANPDFSVEELSRCMHVSRVALYKKLLNLTGKTPVEFIRLLRLKRAAHLLLVSQQTVAEVAYEVGFNNPKYFARYFKEEFGVLPSQYLGNDITK